RRGPPRRGDREGRHEGDSAHRERRGPGPGRRARQRAAQGARDRLPRAGAHLARGFPGGGLDETTGTGAVGRVLIDTSNGQREWTTVGVSENIIEASWE